MTDAVLSLAEVTVVWNARSRDLPSSDSGIFKGELHPSSPDLTAGIEKVFNNSQSIGRSS